MDLGVQVYMEVAVGGHIKRFFQGTCFPIHNCWQKGTWIVDVESLEFENSHATTVATFRETTSYINLLHLLEWNMK